MVASAKELCLKRILGNDGVLNGVPCLVRMDQFIRYLRKSVCVQAEVSLRLLVPMLRSAMLANISESMFHWILLACFAAASTGAHAQEAPNRLFSAKTIVRDRSAMYDGVWSGAGVRISGNCFESPTIKFSVKQGRILMDRFSDGAFYGGGSSKVFGVIHVDRTVDLTLIDRGGNRGRTSQAYGAIDDSGEMALTDAGGCTYQYKLRKG